MRAKRLDGLLLALLAAMIGLGGCGVGSSSPRVEVSAATLPKLGDPLPPLDDDRVSIAPPADWVLLRRSKQYLTCFHRSNQEVYPAIVVTVEACDRMANVTAANLDDYALLVAEELKEQARRKQQADQGDGSVKLNDSIRPLAIGQFNGVTYSRRVRTSEGVFDQYFIETIKGGRRYIFELRDLENAGAAWKPHLYAVASGMKFLGDKPSQ